MGFVTLDDVTGFGDDVDAVFAAWRKGIENANNWSITGEADFSGSASDGFAIRVKRGNGVTSAVVTEEIGAKPSTNKLGVGKVRLRLQKGDDLTDGPEVTVYSNFGVPIPVGTQCEVGPNGTYWKLVGSDCPPPE